ncbi:hypothetical protein LCGC14_1611700, partial [marine sediment metagenome]
CGTVRPLVEFSVSVRYKDGRQSWCKQCFATYSRKRNRRLSRRKRVKIPVEQKCSTCGVVKPSSMFSPDRTNLHGIGACCKTCRRIRLRAQRYGLSVEALTTLLQSHDGCCQICARAFEAGRRPVIDHSHETGAIRGLLCASCNRALGMMEDNAEWLLAAVAYIRKAHG